MGLSMDHREELSLMMDRLREGQLEAQSEERLMKWVSLDPEVAAFVVEYLDLSALLEWKYAPVNWRDLLDEPSDGSNSRVNVLSDIAKLDRSYDDTGDQPPSTTVSRTSVALPRWLFPNPVAALVLGCLLLGVAVLSWLAIREDEADMQRLTATGSATTTLENGKTSVASNPNQSAVATVLRVADCTFEEGSTTVKSGMRLSPGFELKILTGFVGIVFDDETRVIVGGPAKFRIDSYGRGRLDYGELLARVHNVTGFTVDVGDMQVVDKGTQFGIRVDPDGTAELYTLDGAVDLVESGGEGSTSDQPSELTVAGDVKRLNTKGAVSWEDMTVNPDHLTSFLTMVAAAGGSWIESNENDDVFSEHLWLPELAEEFMADSLDSALWQVVSPTLPKKVRSGTSPPSATLVDGNLQLCNGCILQTTKEYNPGQQPVHLKARWHVDKRGDHLGVVLRAGQHSPHLELGRDYSIGGIRCFYEPNANRALGHQPSIIILTQAGGESGNDLSVCRVPFSSLVVGRVYEYDITDDGHRITFTVRELGGLLNRSATATLEVPRSSTKNHILLHNYLNPKIKKQSTIVHSVVIELADDNPSTIPEGGDS